MMFQVLRRFFRLRRILGGSVKIQALVLFALLLWFATSGFLYFEVPGKPDLGWGDALWWAVVTMATVGYGDVFPVTPGGRYLIAVPTMVFGIGFLGYLISEIAGTLIETRSRRLRGMLPLDFHDHVLIVNLPRLDTMLKLVRELRADAATAHKQIALVDECLEELPPELEALGLRFVKGDPTRAAVLEKAGLTRASHAIVLTKDPGNGHCDDHNLVTTLVMERLNPKVFTVVEIMDADKVAQVEMAGADSVVCAAEITTSLIVQELQDPGVKAIIRDLTSDATGHQLYFVPIVRTARNVYGEVAAWAQSHRATLIGISREGREQLNCPPETPLRPGDRAILLAEERPWPIDTTA